MFKDLGVPGHDMRMQHFSTSIDAAEFSTVTRGLSLSDAIQTDPAHPPAALLNFFAKTGPRYASDKLARWSAAAPIVDRYREFRNQGLDAGDRRDLWRDFAREIIDEGLYETGGWAPRPFEEDEQEAAADYVDFDDWRDYDF